MPDTTATLSPGEPDPDLLHKLGLIESVYLGAVALMAFFALCGWLIPPLGHLLPGDWAPMRPQTAIAALCSALSLTFSRPRFSGLTFRVSQALAGIVALLAGTVLLEYLFHVSSTADSLSAAHPGRMPLQTAAAFALLAVVTILIRVGKGFASMAADICVSAYCLLVLAMVPGTLYGARILFGPNLNDRISPFTLLALALLAFAAFTRRAAKGVFKMFLGAGSGSRAARIAAPLVLLVPFLPQAAQVQAIRAGLSRAESAGAIATAVAAMLGFGVILYMAWKINALEKKVRDLSTRDEVTGLYNRRGFHLVAWQSLRDARRSSLPFSVLFIDLENLKQVNESHGYRAGSAYLCEMAELLKVVFRETDVMGRIGGAQFAVAGHFSATAIGTPALRLREAANYRNSDPGRAFNLKFNIGHATSSATRSESLEDLLARADKATPVKKPGRKQARE